MVRGTRPRMCNCTSGNLEIPGSRGACHRAALRADPLARPGMTCQYWSIEHALPAGVIARILIPLLTSVNAAHGVAPRKYCNGKDYHETGIWHRGAANAGGCLRSLKARAR